MRIIMLSWEYPPRIVGGISPHVHDLSESLARQGVEVHVVTKATPAAPDEETEPSGVHVHRVQLGASPKNFVHEIQLLNAATERRVRRLLEDWRPGGAPTLFHAHDWLSLDSAKELKYEYSLPVVATIHATEHGRHGGISGETSRYIHGQEYWLSYEAWRIIVASEFMKAQVHSIFDAPLDKIDVIYNGVSASKFQFDWSEEARLERRLQLADPHERIVLYVGRFVREKGIQLLLDAAPIVLSRLPKVKFVVVGGGHRDRFERFAQWAAIDESVNFPGFQSGRPLYEMYRCADVAVFPSLYEPFGIVALEAMAAGVPVVASDAGGLREVVLHDKTGTSHYAGNAESLAWAILRVLEDPRRAATLVANATARLSTDFHWERIAEQTIQTYEQVWSEFLESYWADRTLWPVSPGAAERAIEHHVKEKAVSGRAIEALPVATIEIDAPLDLDDDPLLPSD